MASARGKKQPSKLGYLKTNKNTNMKTQNTKNRTQKNWDTFATLVTIAALSLVIFGAVQIFVNL